MRITLEGGCPLVKPARSAAVIVTVVSLFGAVLKEEVGNASGCRFGFFFSSKERWL